MRLQSTHTHTGSLPTYRANKQDAYFVQIRNSFICTNEASKDTEKAFILVRQKLSKVCFVQIRNETGLFALPVLKLPSILKKNFYL